MFAVTEFKGLDPASVKTPADLQAFVGKAVAAVGELEDNDAARARAIEDLSKKLQSAVENAQPRGQQVAVDGRDADLTRRYLDSQGRISMRASRRTKMLGGKSIAIEQAGLLDETEGVSPWQADFKKAVEEVSWGRLLLGKGSEGDRALARLIGVAERAPAGIREQVLDQVGKALTDSAGTGAEWIQDGYFTSLYEEMELPRRLAGLFPVVPMANATMKLPKLVTGARPYIRERITTDDPTNYVASTPVTSEDTVTVTNMVVRVVLDEMDAEDMAFAYQPVIRRAVVAALEDGYEDAMVNGDTNATHQDTGLSGWNIRSRWGASGLGGTADHRRMFIGLRGNAIDRSKTTDMGSLQTAANIGSYIIGGMGERGASDLAIITSPEVLFTKLLADSNLITIDKMGGMATLLTGQVAQLFGHPVIMSRFVDAQYNASGIYDDSTKTKSGVLGVDRSAWFHYQRRGVLVEMKREIIDGSVNIVATLRRVFKTPSGTSEAVAYWGYNWL